MYGYVGLMYINEEYRKQKIGRKIFESIVAWFKEKGIEDIRLKVLVPNEATIAAYERWGFKPSIIEMRYFGD